MLKEKILIVGGAGYIGSHTVSLMAGKEYNLIVLDNLVYGHRESIPNPEVEFIEGELGDRDLLKKIFTENNIIAVMHFAAYAYVGESVENPSKYYNNNVVAPIALLDAMKEYDCSIFIFSSTCATYGNPKYIPLDEKHPQEPINPYGQGKLMLERILADYDRAYGLRYANLRYFNAAGAREDGQIGEDHDPETHLIPLTLDAVLGRRENITVFGTDYDTPDGTCIRDYIHIQDLARAHILGLEYLRSDHSSFSCNLGTGTGISVKEIIDTCERVTGKKVPVIFGNRRAGDPPSLVAAPAFAKELLGWEAEFKDISETIRTAWNWMTGPKQGKF